MTCACSVAYPTAQPGVWERRPCRRQAVVGQARCWQHGRMIPCCPDHQRLDKMNPS